MACWSVFVIAIGSFMMVAGTYGSVVSIIDSYNASGRLSAALVPITRILLRVEFPGVFLLDIYLFCYI